MEAIQLALEIKFGDEELSFFQRIETITDLEKLDEIKSTLRKAESLNQLESLL